MYEGDDQNVRRMHQRLEEQTSRIAQALHDEAGQLLSVVHLAIAEVAAELPSPARQRLKRISELLDQVSEQLRHLAHELRPLALDHLGLLPALEFLADGASRRAGYTVTIEPSIEERLPGLIEVAVYRILQEALTNVGRHAHAHHVCVRLRRDGAALRYSITDDGVGFPSDGMDLPGCSAGLGLIGIRERVATFGGTLKITTAPGRGTTLDMTIPLGLLADASAAATCLEPAVQQAGPVCHP